MNTRLANFFSFVFHPLWMPLISFLILTLIDPTLVYSQSAKNTILFFLGINILLPAVSIYYLIKRGLLSGLELINRKERSIPYLLVIFYFSMFYFVVERLSPVVSDVVYSMFLSVIVSLVLSLLVNLKWKISIHLMAIGGFCGSLIGLSQVHPEVSVFGFLVFAIIIAGWVGYSRIHLKAHTASQVNVGFLVGAIIQYIFVTERIVLHF